MHVIAVDTGNDTCTHCCIEVSVQWANVKHIDIIALQKI